MSRSQRSKSKINNDESEISKTNARRTPRPPMDSWRIHANAGMARLVGDSKALDKFHPALEPPPEATKSERPGSLDKIVFGVSALIAVAFVAWGIISPTAVNSVANKALDWTVNNLGWLFALTATLMVFFIIWLALSKFGAIPLGRDGEEPEFRTISWIAMMFSAGMGIGLIFYGAAEPLAHFVTPPPGTEAQSDRAAVSLATTLFHWGLHPWAMYAVAGVAIAYSVFRKGRPLTTSAVFEPILGKRQTYGPGGKIIDIFAIFATLFGSATSLGLGALQIAEGAEIVNWTGRAGNGFLIGIITILTICFILSAVSGVSRGIQYLSNINMVLAVLLALFVFVLGPTIFILNLVPTGMGTYLQELLWMSGRTGAAGGAANEWLSGWTIFYWAWWMSWTPFVGMFIARISKGRTIRQFVSGVLLVPTAVSLAWFVILGGASIDKEAKDPGSLSELGSNEGVLFGLLEGMPLAGITTLIVIILVAIFFVSGADAGSIVMGTLSENGTISPRRWTVIFWGAATGAAAAVMLISGGQDALNGLQSILIVSSVPFLFVMIGMMVALVKDLRRDPMVVRKAYADAAIDQAVVEGVSRHGDDFQLALDKAAPGEGVGTKVDTEDIEQAYREAEEFPSE